MSDEQAEADLGRAAIVVGGGIGGLAAARALQQAGWPARVLEQASKLEPLGAGISLWPNAVHALETLGVVLPRRPPTERAGSGGVRTSRGRWLTRTDPTTFPARYGVPLVAVHRADLQRALHASLAPDTVVLGARVEHIDQQGDRVVVRHSHGDDSADLVVLADGLASPHRHLVAGRVLDSVTPATRPGAA